MEISKEDLNELSGLEALGRLLTERSRKLRLKLAGGSPPATTKKTGLPAADITKTLAKRRAGLARTATSKKIKTKTHV